MTPFLVRWQLEIAFQAMALQYERLHEGSPQLRPDSYLFAVAMAQVVKAAEITDDALGTMPTRGALEGFRAAFPEATHVRNILEHWEDYAEGKGHLQKGGAFGAVDLLNVTESDRGELVLEVGPMKLNIWQAAWAARRLYEKIALELEANSREYRGGPWPNRDRSRT
jgi:hypothetical protein